MPPLTLDPTGAKGAGRRNLDAVPDAFRRAFDELVRLAVSGEEGAGRLAAIAEAANRTEGAVSRDRREGE